LEESPPPKKFDPGKSPDKTRSGRDMDELPKEVQEAMMEVEERRKDPKYSHVFALDTGPPPTSEGMEILLSSLSEVQRNLIADLSTHGRDDQASQS
jgi:hypothetical protein